MNPERYRVVSYGRRLVVAVTSEDSLQRISGRLRDLGAHPSGPSAWDCSTDVTIEGLVAAIGELSGGEVVYIFGGGEDRFAYDAVVAPKIDGGVTVAT